MRASLQILVLFGLFIPAFLLAQTNPPSAESTHELKLLLQPQGLVDGVPHAWIFILTNVSNRDLRIPSPEINCNTPTPNGAIRLVDVWLPAIGTKGIGSGFGDCGPEGSALQPDRTPFVQRARAWALLEPGKSIYFKMTTDPTEGAHPGRYQFSGTYDPPTLSKKLLQELLDTGINVPCEKVQSPVLEYRK